MKNEIKLIPVVLIAIALGFTGCKKDASTSGSPALGVKIVALNKSYALPVVTNGIKSAEAGTASITWDTAYMTVSKIKYEAEMKTLNTKTSTSFEWTGPQIISLFDTTISIGNFVLQPGLYNEMELTVKGFKHDAGNKPVFYLHGNYSSGSIAAIPVQVVVNEDVMFKTEMDSINVTTADNSGFTSIITLKLDELMADISLAVINAATLSNGAIIISANSNRELYMIIMRNLSKKHHTHHDHGYHYGQMGHMD